MPGEQRRRKRCSRRSAQGPRALSGRPSWGLRDPLTAVGGELFVNRNKELSVPRRRGGAVSLGSAGVAGNAPLSLRDLQVCGAARAWAQGTAGAGLGAVAEGRGLDLVSAGPPPPPSTPQHPPRPALPSGRAGGAGCADRFLAARFPLPLHNCRKCWRGSCLPGSPWKPVERKGLGSRPSRARGGSEARLITGPCAL